MKRAKKETDTPSRPTALFPKDRKRRCETPRRDGAEGRRRPK